MAPPRHDGHQDELFAAAPAAEELPGPRPRAVRVLPDVPAIDKTFDYLVPEHLGDQVRVGSVVRITLSGRRVGGWVLEDHVTPPEGIKLLPINKVTGWGPPADVLELAAWGAWRWAGRLATVLVSASAEHAVPGLPRGRDGTAPVAVPAAPVRSAYDELVTAAFGRARSVVRLPPAADPYPVVLAAAARGNALVLAPTLSQARHLGLRLRRAGQPTAILPKEWASARAGAIVVGARGAAWAPVRDLAAVVVLDEHDESYQQEQAPTWHARDVAIERAARAGVPCVLVSPVPTLEATTWAGEGGLLVPARSAERDGWPILDLIDRRGDPPGAGLYSERLVKALRTEGRVVCVINRKGRSRLLACASCGEVAQCERCQAAVVQTADGALVCRRCETSRPQVCQACGATKLKNQRAGVTRVREELEALLREPVAELTADTPGGDTPRARVVVGTEAVLHQVPDAVAVAFLDFDQELLAPRYRAAEQAMALLVRAARLLARHALEAGAGGEGRAGLGRIVIQTRQPHHETIQAALHAEPTRLSQAEARRREVLRFPPVAALAAVSGAAAPAYVEAFGHPAGVEVLGPADGQWLLRAPDHQTLCDALAATARPPGRLRLEVDPLRL